LLSTGTGSTLTTKAAWLKLLIEVFAAPPTGRKTAIGTLSQDGAPLCPGLFSCLPSGKAAVIEPLRQPKRASLHNHNRSCDYPVIEGPRGQEDQRGNGNQDVQEPAHRFDEETIHGVAGSMVPHRMIVEVIRGLPAGESQTKGHSSRDGLLFGMIRISAGGSVGCSDHCCAAARDETE
jgi:hypothetical protein